MLKQLSSCLQWFLDATFKVAPQGYKQIFNIIVYTPSLKMFYPACHVIMSHKTEELYTMVLLSLKQIAKSARKFVLELKIIMLDFEAVMRNALKTAIS